MCALLKLVKAAHKEYCGAEYTKEHHKTIESSIVEVTGCIRRLYLKLICHILLEEFWHPVAHLLEPACVVHNDMDVVVDLVFGKEDRIAGAPLRHLLMYNLWFHGDKAALLNVFMLNPHCRRLNVAIIVFLGVEDKYVELFIKNRKLLQRCMYALDADIVICLNDVSLEIVVAESFARKAELCERAKRNLYFGSL